jgi:hypothetical protein
MKLPVHVVRCRGKEQRNNMTIMQMREEENRFFTAPGAAAWRQFGVSCVGTNALQERLSVLLQDRVRKELPKVQAELKQKLSAAKATLDEMGADLSTPSAKRLIFMQSVTRVQGLVDAAIMGQYMMDRVFFANVSNRICAKVLGHVELFNSKMIKLNRSREKFQEGDIAFISDGTNEGFVVVEKMNNSNNSNNFKGFGGGFSFSSPPVLDKVEDVSGYLPDGFCFRDDTNTLRPSKDNVKSPGVMHIYSLIKSARGRELPGFLSFDVFCTVLQEYVEEWRGATDELIEAVARDTRAGLSNAVRSGSARPAAEELERALLTVLDRVMVTINNDVQAAFHREAALPSTQNHYLGDRLQKSSAERIIKRLKLMRADGDGKVGLNDAISVVESALSIGKTSNEIFEAEQLLQFLTAYIGVAKKRFIDNIQQIINSGLNQISRGFLEASTRTDHELGFLEETIAAKQQRILLNKQVEIATRALEDFAAAM